MLLILVGTQYPNLLEVSVEEGVGWVGVWMGEWVGVWMGE